MLHTTDKTEEGKNIVLKVIISYMMVNTHVNNSKNANNIERNDNASFRKQLESKEMEGNYMIAWAHPRAHIIKQLTTFFK